MRLFYLIIMIAGFQTAKAQDFCKRIKSEVSPDKVTFEYTSPFDPDDKTIVHVNRNFSKDPENGYENFYVIFQMIGELDSVYEVTPTGGQKEKQEKSLVVEFDDKSTIVDENIKVNHDFTDDRTQATRYVFCPLTESNLKDFTSKKIVKYKIAGHEQLMQPDSAVSIMHYIRCMKDIKK